MQLRNGANVSQNTSTIKYKEGSYSGRYAETKPGRLHVNGKIFHVTADTNMVMSL